MLCCSNVLVGRARKLGLFRVIDKLVRHPIRVAGPGFHLNEDQYIAIICDDIYFQIFIAPVLVSYPIPMLLQQPCCRIFPLFTFLKCIHLFHNDGTQFFGYYLRYVF